MSDTDPVPEVSDDATPTEESAAPAPQIDLVAEASQAAAQQPTEGRIRSLDELDVDGAVRGQIESYVSKAVNDAVTKHDARQQTKLDNEGYMNRTQIEELLSSKEAEHQRREAARDTFLTVLGSEGIHPGSDDYTKIQVTFREAVDAGKLTPEILLNEAGIRTLVAMSGLSKFADAASPQSGLARSAPAPDGSVQYADGTVQLNANTDPQTPSLEEQVRRRVAEASKNLGS